MANEITVRELELLVRRLKHAVKARERVRQRFGDHPITNKNAERAYQKANKELASAERTLTEVCRQITEEGLVIRLVV